MTAAPRASKPAMVRLFNHCGSGIGPSHISNNVPNDPGSAGYDEALQKILKTGSLPSRPQFEADYADLSETFLSIGGEFLGDDEVQFRRFRMFVFSIALDATDRDLFVGFLDPFPSVIVGCLLTDIVKLRDSKAYPVVRAALADVEIPHPYRYREELPFLTLGALIASRLCGYSYTAMEPLVVRLFAEIADAESEAIGQTGPEMFWALGAGTMRETWQELIREHLSDSPPESKLNWIVTELLK